MTDRNEAIAAIKTSLEARSGKKCWSVKGDRGTAWGWIHINVKPGQQVDGQMTAEQRAELAELLGCTVHTDGVSIPASSDYRNEYIARAAGLTPIRVGTPYWD